MPPNTVGFLALLTSLDFVFQAEPGLVGSSGALSGGESVTLPRRSSFQSL